MSRNRHKAHRFGLSAEKIARWLLKLKGYEILAERYRNAFGEIDIVARRGKTVAIVEVKARRHFRDCLESMTPDKQARLARAAASLIAYPGKFTGRIDASAHTIRFDLIMVVPWRLPRHITNAWSTS